MCIYQYSIIYTRANMCILIFLNKISSSNIGISLPDMSLAFHKMTTYPVLDSEYSSFYFKVAVTSIVWLLAIRCRKERNMVLYYYVDYFFFILQRIFESFPLCFSLETDIISVHLKISFYTHKIFSTYLYLSFNKVDMI